MERLLVLHGASPADASAVLPDVDSANCTVIDASAWPRAAIGSEWSEVAVLTGSLAELRQLVPLLALAGMTRRVLLAVLHTDRLRSLQVPVTVAGAEVIAARRLTFRAPAPCGPAAVGVRVSVMLSRAVAVPATALAMLSAARSGGANSDCAGLRLGLTALDARMWTGSCAGTLVGAKTRIVREVEHEVFDFLVGPQVHAQPDPRVPRLGIDGTVGALVIPPVDTKVISPLGFRRDAAGFGAIHIAEEAPETIRLTGVGGEDLGGGSARVGLTENHIRALRSLSGVELQAAAGAPLVIGRVVAQLCCAGVPVRVTAPPPSLVPALGSELAERLTSLRAADVQDPIARASWSVTTRRLALSRFAAEPYWRAIASQHGKPAVLAPTVSALLTTRRPDYLAFALAQIERQDWPDLEAVVVLHGVPASHPEVRAAVEGFSRPIVVVEVGSDVVFGAALNAGTARCSGDLVTKMDDDDWYGPHHVTDLVQAKAYSGAALVGIAGFDVYLHASNMTVRMMGRKVESMETWLAGPTLLLGASDLRAVGGWRAVPSAVDWHLLNAVRRSGGEFYAIHDLGFLYYRGHEHTWSASDEGWLARDPARRSGLDAPPQLYPLPHPRVGSAHDPHPLGPVG